MSGPSTYQPQNAFLKWFEARLPIGGLDHFSFVGYPTLERFFSLHYLLPFVIAGVVVLHVWALHVAGQNNPAGIDVKSGQDTVPFTPHATIKDGFMVMLFCLFFAWFVFYVPNY